MLKSALVIVSALLVAGSVSSQSLQLINPVTVVQATLEEVGENGELVADWHVQNISENNLSVRCYRNVTQEVPGSENYFCWGVCFTSATDISPVQIAQQMPGGSVNDSFYAHYRPNGNPGQTTVEYCFFDNQNPDDKVCQVVTYCADMEECVVGINRVESAFAELTIAPSVLSGFGKIQYTLPAGARSAEAEIYSLTGQVVQRFNLTGPSGVVLINGQDLTNGAYILRVRESGRVVGTTRLIVAH